MGVTLANFHCTGLSPVQWKVARVTPILHIISAFTTDITICYAAMKPYLRFGSSSFSIWTIYTSFESSWPADFDYLSFGSIP